MDSPARHQGNGQTDVEMSDIRLLDEEDDYNIPFGQSNLTSVLANPDFGRRRPLDRFRSFCEERPSPLFNIPATGCAALAVTFLVLFLAALPSSRLAKDKSTGLSGSLAPGQDVDLTSPQGFAEHASSMAYDYKGRPRMLSSQQGMVAADQGDCSALGTQILRQQGNAVDAAISTTLCQGIMSPAASGLGGGHFMVIRAPNGTTEVIDAREPAPAAASRDMYKGRPDAAVNGGLAIAVPLELKGLWLAHQRHGILPWADLVAPVIPLARAGFPLHPYLARTIGDGEWLRPYPAVYETYMIRDNAGWRPPRINETCCARPAFANALQRIADQGPDAVYAGAAGQELAREIQAVGGIMTAEDLQSAQPSVKPVVTAQVWGYELMAPPPPSSAAAVIAALNVLSGYAAPLAGANALGSHHLVEAMKEAFALRMQLGDPGPNNAFLNTDAVVADMLSPSYAAQLRANISDRATQSYTVYGSQYRQGMNPDDHGTSHLSVVDADRGAVAMTTTINTGFGSKVISNSTGLILNNQMDDFSTPDQANVYGLSPSAPNFVRPGKKPLSSMSPTLLQDRQGRLVGALGASGGPRIVTAVLQTLVRLLAMGQDPLEAVSGARLHHQLLPDAVRAEYWNVTNSTGPSFLVTAAEVEGLRARGHEVDLGQFTAVTQAIVVDPILGTLVGASDPRKDGAPAAY